MPPMTFTQLREKRRLTKAQLARAAGVNDKTVWWIEAGKVTDPRYGTLSALAEVLGVTPAFLAAIVRKGGKAA